MFPMTVTATINSAEELAEFSALFSKKAGGKIPTPPEKIAPAKEKPAAEAKAKEPAKEESTKALTHDDVIKAATSLVQKGKRAIVVDLLEKHGAPTVRELTEDQLANFHADVQEALADE